MTLNISMHYGDLNKGDNGYIDGTTNVNFLWEGTEINFQILFQTREKLDQNRINQAVIFLTWCLNDIEDIIIYPVLYVQLILISAGCELVFHRDKANNFPEAKFHKVFFHIGMLVDSFKKIGKMDEDGMKRVRQFKHEPLKDLFYKHVMDASISGIAKNLLNENRSSNWLMQNLEEEFGSFDGTKKFGKEHSEFLANALTDVSFRRRQNRNAMSGEWLIFKKYNNKFHMLTFASHQESDQRIFDRIKAFLPAVT